MKALFSVVKWNKSAVWITDNDSGAMTVTNNAEEVCAYLEKEYPSNRRIFYRDTDGVWGELIHDHGVFLSYREMAPAEQKVCPKVS